METKEADEAQTGPSQMRRSKGRLNKTQEKFKELLKWEREGLAMAQWLRRLGHFH